MSVKDSSYNAGSVLGVHGIAIATVISYSLYHSVLWAFLHGAFGWFYVFYYLYTR